jgi:hypothetical protein
VALAYVEWFGLGASLVAGVPAGALALVRFGPLHLQLSVPASQRPFGWLLDPGPRQSRARF